MASDGASTIRAGRRERLGDRVSATTEPRNARRRLVAGRPKRLAGYGTSTTPVVSAAAAEAGLPVITTVATAKRSVGTRRDRPRVTAARWPPGVGFRRGDLLIREAPPQGLVNNGR
ncbi:hypothetical protein GCM10010331_17360 [Streptomyces xanthochromogenes]|nr:hypothetical protein GCM10010331_17360 [Streptomyces xanthochromogenes]